MASIHPFYLSWNTLQRNERRYIVNHWVIFLIVENLTTTLLRLIYFLSLGQKSWNLRSKIIKPNKEIRDRISGFFSGKGEIQIWWILQTEVNLINNLLLLLRLSISEYYTNKISTLHY